MKYGLWNALLIFSRMQLCVLQRLTWRFYSTAAKALSTLINIVIQGSYKIRQFLPHTPCSRVHPTRSSKNLSLSDDMAENNEVIGGDKQLGD